MSSINHKAIFGDEDTPEPQGGSINYKAIFGDEDAPEKSAEEPSWANDLWRSYASGSNHLLAGVGTLYGLFSGDMDNALRRTGESGAKFWSEGKSDELKEAEKARSRAVEEADGVLAKAGAAVWGTVKDGRLAATFFTEQLPMLIPAGAAGRLGKLTSEALGAGSKVAGRVGTGTAVATGAAQQTGDVIGGMYDDLMTLPDEIWEENPSYTKLRDEIGPDEAKHQIALEQSRKIAPFVAGTSIVSQTLIPRGTAAEKVLSGTTGKVAGKSRLHQTATGFLGEAAQESIEEGSGAVLSNVGKREIDPSQDLTEGLGEAAGLGALAGGVLGGAISALGPSGSEQDAFDKLRQIQQSTSVEEALNAAETMASTPTPQIILGPPTEPKVMPYSQEQPEAGSPDALARQAEIDATFEGATGTESKTTTYKVGDKPKLDTGDARQAYIDALFDEGTDELSTERLDSELAKELRRAEGITERDETQRRVASTKLGKPKNTQVADQLTKAKSTKKRNFSNEITPKTGSYASREAAAHALRGKMQTVNLDKLAELAEFHPAESSPGSGKWVLRRTKREVGTDERKGQAEDSTVLTTSEQPSAAPEGTTGQEVIPEADRTVTRAEVLTALRDSGVTGFAKQREALLGMTPVSEDQPHTFKLDQAKEVLSRYQLEGAKGTPVLETGLKPAVQKAFPTGKVETLESGAQRVRLPNGSVVTVNPDQTITVDKESAKRAYGKRYKGQEKATGSFTRVGEDGVIWLSKEADQGTVNHEAFHMAFQTALSNRERSALVKKYGSEEGAAEAYGSWSTKQKNGTFEKILKFFRAVREALFGPSATGTMSRIETGEAFETQGEVEDVTPVGEPAYEVSPPVEEPQTPKGTPLNLLRLEVVDEDGRTANVRADRALKFVDDKIHNLEQLRRCLG